MNLLEDLDKPVVVHRFLKAVPHSLIDERMIGNLAIAGDVLQTGGGIWKCRGQQIVSEHPLELRSNLLSTAAPWHRQRDCRVPTPTRLEHGRVQKCLHQHIACGVWMQIAEDVSERKRMLWS